MKKVMLTTAAAFALMAAPLVSNKVDAASNQPTKDCNTTGKVATYQYKFNSIDDLKKWLKEKGITFNTVNTVQTVNNEKSETASKSAPSKSTSNAAKQTTTTTNTNKAQSTPTTTSANKNQTTASDSTSALNAYEKQVVDLTNKERAKNGLKPLQVDATLSKMARAKSNDMMTNKYFDHTSPTYGSPFDMMKKFGISYKSAGENIAMGQQTPEEVVNSWMNSPGHRANILNKNYTHIGVGYVENGHYWTQEFIQK
ncbi:CAP domain-containing protein [Heyndrickxia ginsengihumi]|uniref:Serine protease n=1 Tax=Heyndrickxia ginsengihumi TaxID=363870 RepID=A0A6M0P6Q4_9BACI|nr:CAP domain-containing protein [Heyndrickxia ginsengihumi]MBE6184244.1 serine protease [Bacillus sp. (in: firmicutes)]MCM3023460.1 CAP domain-containing protein [Heyndrickxia ginsengihumi]NEY20384.1 serine protease [Heyndrickxia ginsengihumi]